MGNQRAGVLGEQTEPPSETLLQFCVCARVCVCPSDSPEPFGAALL